MKKEPFRKDIKIPCSSCKQETWHTIILRNTEYEYEKQEDEGTVSIKEIHERIACCGCGQRANRDYKTKSNLYEGGEVTFDEIRSPNYQIWHKQPKNELTTHLSPKVVVAYKEVIDTYNFGSNIACATMILHTLEGIGSDVKVELEQEGQNPLNIKLNNIARKLKDKELITPDLVNVLLGLGYLGNKAKHALENWNKDHLNIAILLMEHILQNIVIKDVYDRLFDEISKKERRE